MCFSNLKFKRDVSKLWRVLRWASASYLSWVHHSNNKSGPFIVKSASYICKHDHAPLISYKIDHFHFINCAF